MKRSIFVLIFSILVHTHTRKLFQIGSTEYTMRITNFTDCEEFKENPMLVDVKLLRNGNTQLINGQLNLPEDFCAKLVNVKINRCQNYNFACEYFQTWNITDICVFTKMKNSMWHSFHDAIRPTNWLKNCPCFKKGMLTITNGTLDLNEIIKFYPEAAKYHWQVKAQIYDRKMIKQECLYLTFYLTSYNSKIPVSTEKQKN